METPADFFAVVIGACFAFVTLSAAIAMRRVGRAQNRGRKHQTLGKVYTLLLSVSLISAFTSIQLIARPAFFPFLTDTRIIAWLVIDAAFCYLMFTMVCFLCQITGVKPPWAK